MEVDGKHYTEKEDAGKAIIDVCTRMTGSDAVLLGQYRGCLLYTSEEQEILSRYVGWGGLANCFEQTSPHYEELKMCIRDSRRAVQNSIGYMLLVRGGLDPSEYFEDEDFRDVLNFNTPQTLNALGVATGDISQMCLSAISRTVRVPVSYTHLDVYKRQV